MALATLIGLMLMFAVLVVLPAIVGVAQPQLDRLVRMLLRWPALLAVVFVTLLALYRFAPSPRPLGPHKTTDVGGPVNLPHRPSATSACRVR